MLPGRSTTSFSAERSYTDRDRSHVNCDFVSHFVEIL